MGPVGDFLQVRDDIFEVVDQDRFSFRTPVALVIRPDHAGTCRAQGIRHVIVASDVFAIAMREKCDPGCLIVGP